MSKTSSVERNKKRIKMAGQYADRRQKLKSVVRDRELPLEQRFEAQLQLSGLPRNSSRTRVRNRCELTGRPRGYYRKFNLCRIVLRDLASFGLIPGMTKSSW